MENFKKLIELVEVKNRIDIKRGEEKYLDINWALDEIISEVQEVRDEIKESNHTYLDDELADILWGWLMLVKKTNYKNLSSDIKSIADKALIKYSQRITPLKGDKQDYKRWKEVKEIQKRRLEEEHRSRKCKE
jgi:NTP pyrophosphatase (non-canonical NTP hydrolase)